MKVPKRVAQCGKLSCVEYLEFGVSRGDEMCGRDVNREIEYMRTLK